VFVLSFLTDIFGDTVNVSSRMMHLSHANRILLSAGVSSVSSSDNSSLVQQQQQQSPPEYDPIVTALATQDEINAAITSKLFEEFVIEERGDVFVKGKGNMRTLWLIDNQPTKIAQAQATSSTNKLVQNDEELGSNS